MLGSCRPPIEEPCPNGSMTSSALAATMPKNVPAVKVESHSAVTVKSGYSAFISTGVVSLPGSGCSDHFET